MTRRGYFLQTDQLRDSDHFVLFHDNDVLVRGEQFVWHLDQLNPKLLGDSPMFLIEDEASAFVAVHATSSLVTQLEAENRSLRSLLFSEGDHAFSIVGKANQILDWYTTHRFCGRCGTPTQHHSSERAVFCPSCKSHYYPRINPCAIVLVVRGRQVLLARSARFRSGFFSCLAGFIEVGESAEDTVLREVKEEVGILVNNIRYLKSQSWPFPSQLMLGFIADYQSGEIVPEPGEIEEAGWYDIDNLPNVPIPGISVAGELIEHYVAQARSGTL